MKNLTIKEFIEKAKIIHGNLYNYSNVNYEHNKIKVEIICKTHGSFWQTPNNHLSGYGCIDCGGTKRLTTQAFIKKAKGIHKNLYDYSRSNYKNDYTKIIIKCKILNHGFFKVTPNNHLIKQSGCPKCMGRNRTTKEFIEMSNKIHNNFYNYSTTIYKKSHIKLMIICPLHGKFNQSPHKHLMKQGCPQCKTEMFISKNEIDFLNYLGISKNNHQIKIGNYYVDGMRDNIIYEFLGDFWHGNPEKFNPNKTNPLDYYKRTYKQLYDYTFYRFDKLKYLGHNIKYIWENDWNKFKRGIDKTPKILTY